MVLAGGDADVYYTGDGTANAVGQTAAGTCNSGIGDNYAALNSDQWNSTLNCSKCVEVVCDDDRCSDTTSPVTVYIVDKCTECEDEGLDLSPAVFKKLTGSDPTRYTIKWEFVTCPENSFSTLKSGGGNTYEAGKVEAANETPSTVSILQANEEGVEKTSSAQQQDESEKQANTKSDASGGASGTSPFIVCLVIAGAVCAVALAAVTFSAKKKKWGGKRDDCVTRSFDTFSSPAQTKATIVKI